MKQFIFEDIAELCALVEAIGRHRSASTRRDIPCTGPSAHSVATKVRWAPILHWPVG